MIDQKVLKEEADRLKAEGFSNRQITARLAEIVSYRYRERPTQALIMDVLWDREAGTRPSASTIQAGIKDFIARESDRHDKGQLGPATWPEDKRAQATELLTGLDQWFQRQIEGEVHRIRREAAEAVQVAREEAQTARRDRDLAVSRATSSEADAQAAHGAREEAQKLLVEARTRIDDLEARIARMAAEGARLTETLEATRKQAAVEREAMREAHQQKLETILAQHRRDQESWQKDNSHLEQLLTASEETIKRLRLDMQREVDRSETMRIDLERSQAALHAKSDEASDLKSRLAVQEARVELMQKEADRLRKMSRPVSKASIKRGLPRVKRY